MTKEKKVQPRNWQHSEQRNKLERNQKRKTVGKIQETGDFFWSITQCKAETMQKQEEEEVLKCFQNVYSLYALNNV